MKIKISLSSFGCYEHVANVINVCKVATFVPHKHFDAIVKTRAIKTLKQVGDSGTNKTDSEKTKSIRNVQENRFLFGNETLYAMYVNQKQISLVMNDNIDGYGDIAFVYKDHIKAKCTAFLGDTTIKSKITGTPIIQLTGGVTGKQVQHWLAQYKIYPNVPVTKVDHVTGYETIAVNLCKFNVDKQALQNSVGAGYNMIEVHHRGNLSVPYDCDAIVVKNKEWIAPIKQYCQKSCNSDIDVIHYLEYDAWNSV